MIKVIFYFLLVSIGAGLVQMKIPLFGRHSKRWEEQNYAQRFGGIFFPAFIALVVIFLFNEYKTAQLPTLNEEMLMNGAEYCLVTDLNEIGDADYAYEIKSGSSQEEICGIISSICIDLKREDDFVNVRYENGEYIIINNGITIGRAVINDNNRFVENILLQLKVDERFSVTFRREYQKIQKNTIYSVDQMILLSYNLIKNSNNY